LSGSIVLSGTREVGSAGRPLDGVSDGVCSMLVSRLVSEVGEPSRHPILVAAEVLIWPRVLIGAGPLTSLAEPAVVGRTNALPRLRAVVGATDLARTMVLCGAIVLVRAVLKWDA
jgi:hypothetical protein